MTTLFEIKLENEMDIMLSQQKMMQCAELLKLNLTTRTTFVTAVAEITRVLTEHTDQGILTVFLEQEKNRYKLCASVLYPVSDQEIESRHFIYVKKLVPVLEFFKTASTHKIEFYTGLPRTYNFSKDTLKKIVQDMHNSVVSAYEEIKNRNNELNKINELQRAELEYEQRINVIKNDFISVASHEIKTPLTVLQAYVQLASRIHAVDELHQLIGKIGMQIKKLTSLSVKMLDSAKIENGKLEYNKQDVTVSPYLKQVLDDLSLMIPDRRLMLNIVGDHDLHIDPIRIEQVIANIITNAAKYSNSGTEILVTCNINNEQALQISVKDSGIGMNEETLEKVFEKFYRDKEIKGSYSGLGMGMFISSQIVEAHGGKIWAESEIGSGSTFHFTIPLKHGLVNA